MVIITIELTRIKSTDNGTFGFLSKEYGDPFCLTYELPWHDNKTNVSCIPAKRYMCILGENSNYKEVFHVHRVPGRENVQIHIGNTAKDTQGCILVGSEFEPLGGYSAVQSSKRAFNELREIVGDKAFWLKIIDKT